MLKITIIGNSVSIRTRPPKLDSDGCYSQLLIKYLKNEKIECHIRNTGYGGRIIYDVQNSLDEYIQTFPDVFIINLGANDVATREVPRWFYNRMQANVTGLRASFCRLVYKVIGKWKTTFVRLRRYKSWVSPTDFIKSLDVIVEGIQKDSNALIIVIGVNQGSNRIGKILPGTLERYTRLNGLLKEYVVRNEIEYIDVASFNSKEDFPDGIHYSSVGHQKVAQMLFDRILNVLSNTI